MADWPTRAEAAAWCNASGDQATTFAGEAFDAALHLVRARCVSFVVDPDAAEPVEDVPPPARMAVLLQTNRWYRRRQSPEGVAAFANGEAIAMTRLDVDVEAALAPWLDWGVA